MIFYSMYSQDMLEQAKVCLTTFYKYNEYDYYVFVTDDSNVDSLYNISDKLHIVNMPIMYDDWQLEIINSFPNNFATVDQIKLQIHSLKCYDYVKTFVGDDNVVVSCLLTTLYMDKIPQLNIDADVGGMVEFNTLNRWCNELGTSDHMGNDSYIGIPFYAYNTSNVSTLVGNFFDVMREHVNHSYNPLGDFINNFLDIEILPDYICSSGMTHVDDLLLYTEMYGNVKSICFIDSKDLNAYTPWGSYKKNFDGYSLIQRIYFPKYYEVAKGICSKEFIEKLENQMILNDIDFV